MIYSARRNASIPKGCIYDLLMTYSATTQNSRQKQFSNSTKYDIRHCQFVSPSLPGNTFRRVCCLYAEHLYKQPPLQPRPSVRLLPTFTWWTPPVPWVSLRVKASSWMMSWRLAAEGLLATDVVWRRSRRRLPGPTTHHTKHTNRFDTLFKGQMLIL